VIRRLPLLLALACSSCGYEVGNLYEIRDVKVDMFDTQSDRRTHEFDLTDAVVHEISARGIRVNAKDAAYTLKGTDQVLVGSLLFTVEIRLIDSNGTELWKDVKSESASFTGARGENFESARQQVFYRLARWVVTHFQKSW
jgi:hypothetical protein